MKTAYQRPFLSVELFSPQEYFASCEEKSVYKGWRAYGDMILTTLYKDTNSDNKYTSSEQLNPDSGNFPSNASADNEVYATVTKPSLLTDYNYYTSYEAVQVGTGFLGRPIFEYQYRGKVATLYKHNNHYFNDIEPVYKTEKNNS